MTDRPTGRPSRRCLASLVVPATALTGVSAGSSGTPSASSAGTAVTGSNTTPTSKVRKRTMTVDLASWQPADCG